jgi:hypothetical protein
VNEETAAAPNVDPDVALTDEEVDKALDISRIEAAANVEDETGAQARADDASGGGPA